MKFNQTQIVIHLKIEYGIMMQSHRLIREINKPNLNLYFYRLETRLTK